MLTDNLGKKTEIFSHFINFFVRQVRPFQNAPVFFVNTCFPLFAFGFLRHFICSTVSEKQM